jgi:hypothetical protein
MESLKVGDTVWLFDGNHRVYENDDGTKSSGAIYSKHFMPRVIEGETKQSWILQYGQKVPKKANGEPEADTRKVTTRPGFHSVVYLTQKAKDDNIWIHMNRHVISHAVIGLTDIDMLKKVAAIIGYKATP